MLLVSLFSSRFLLRNLGVTDYGVYNVVYGLVLFFSFMNGTLTSGTQRYLNYAMGKRDDDLLKRTFKAAFTNHLLMAVIVTLLVLFVGNLIITYLLYLPSNRISQSLLFFNLTALSLFLIIVTVPYQADIIAHEEMNAYAVYSIIDSILKLLAALSLVFLAPDYRIPMYGFALLAISLFDFILYRHYCANKYDEVISKLYWNKKHNIEMLCFSGWDTLGWGASACAGQGVNILLNVFGGTLLNAARGISVQVYSLFNQLVNSFQNAINPQIVKTYAQGNHNESKILLYKSSKYSLLLASLMAIPIIIEMRLVLDFWLGEIPDYSLSFSRIMVVQSMVIGFTRPMVNTIHATGHIKYPSIYSSLVLFLIIPISWLLLYFEVSPTTVLWINILPWVLEGCVYLHFLNLSMNITPIDFLKNALNRPLLVIAICTGLSYCIYKFVPQGLISLFIIAITNAIILTFLSFLLIFDREERDYICKFLNLKFKKT